MLESFEIAVEMERRAFAELHDLTIGQASYEDVVNTVCDWIERDADDAERRLSRSRARNNHELADLLA